MNLTLLPGDALEILGTLPASSVRCCITSPPYFGLRDYGEVGQIGLERTPAAYVARLVEVFRQVRRVLTDDGTLWLNLGDSYATGAGSGRSMGGKVFGKQNAVIDQGGYPVCQPNRMPLPGLKPKDLIGAPWRVAFALQEDGWWLRSDMIWHKTNVMPSSIKDRPTMAHEYVFLFAKSKKYYYDHTAMQEPASYPEGGGNKRSVRVPDGHTPGLDSNVRGRLHLIGPRATRNMRTVRALTTKRFSGAHFATFPPELIEPYVLAGSAHGDTVLDPFNGAGTTGLVALKHGRSYVGIDLNRDYLAMTRQRLGL